MMRFVSLLLLALSGAASAHTLYVLRVFTVPKAEGMELLAKDDKDRALHQQLLDLAKNRPSALERVLVVGSSDGGEVILHEANDLLYPTEFDPAQIPQQMVIGDGALIAALQQFAQPSPTPPAQAPADDANKAEPPPPSQARRAIPAISRDLGIVTSATPTAFSMRGLGDQLKLNSKALDSGKLEVEVSLELTRLAGFQSYNGEMQPQFASRAISTKLLMEPGAPCFLGSCSAGQHTGGEFETKEDTVSLAFLTARAVKPPATISKTPEETDLNALFEVVSLPKADASALLEQATDDAALHSGLIAAIKTGSGRREAILAGRVAEGEATYLSESDEYTYASEFDPPQVPSSFFLADDDLIADARAGRKLARPPAADASPYNGGFGWMTKATPSSFTTRKLGAVLEIDMVRDGENLTLTVRPELARLIGQKTYTGIQQPIFEVCSLSTTVVASIGSPRLLGTLSRPLNTGIDEGNKEDRVAFAFITVRAVK